MSGTVYFYVQMLYPLHSPRVELVKEVLRIVTQVPVYS